MGAAGGVGGVASGLERRWVGGFGGGMEGVGGAAEGVGRVGGGVCGGKADPPPRPPPPPAPQIELPSLREAVVQQLLGPVPVFQFFCASLWLLDEYWNYALFNMFAIGMYECTTAFGRIKNMQAAAPSPLRTAAFLAFTALL